MADRLTMLNILLPEIHKHFPDLKIKFKNESFLMKVLGIILFFNRSFMKDFITTINNTIYIPNKEYLEESNISTFIVLMHELVHVYDSKNKLFKFLYLFPLSLIPLLLPLFFILSWKIVVPLIIFCALPLPAYFRMKYECRAYFTALWIIHYLFPTVVDVYKQDFIKEFKGSKYYFMWIFKSVDKDFDKAVIKIKNGEFPIDGEIGKIIKLLTQTMLLKI